MDKKYFKKEIDKNTIDSINKCICDKLHITKEYNKKNKDEKDIFIIN
jgi:hypothetical protein